ncbi:MAG: gephyrin-like molybdotransferase Glp [Ferruginibacter sp.]
MISVTQAKEIIARHCKAPDPVEIDLSDATGKTLAADITSNLDIPAFAQSSMDGYAFNYDGFLQNENLFVTGEIAAGENKNMQLQQHEAMRIFTGAPIPHGADTVVMQEKSRIENGKLFMEDDKIKLGSNVRMKGSEIKENHVALEAGCLLTSPGIGFLAGIGITKVMAYPAPLITIIVTGNELQAPGAILQYGQVYESNSLALKTALETIGIKTVTVIHVRDHLAEITIAVKKALAKSDMILLTGGVSVGDYDFVVQAAEDCGIEKLFHKVKQKPGKPLYVGKKGNKVIFGLPGNPSSVLTCFYQYVILALQILQKNPALIKIMKAALLSPYNKPAGLTQFLKGYVNDSRVQVLQAQESYRMQSFAKANCLIEIEESVTDLNEGDLVKIYLLPGC